ncbi:MAG: OmpA family protein [Gammaproteobacteria bacterium]|jgi:outer membrane protein OmpA-like peptidoglycan-associated protein
MGLKLRESIMSVTGAALLAAAPAIAQNAAETAFEEADARLGEARSISAELLSPANFERAMDRYADAEEDRARGRSVERIRSSLAEVVRWLDQAIDASEIAAVTLAPLIKTREDALSADAPTFAMEHWAEAEELFDEAARRLESGNIRQAREISTEAETVFRDAELTAIKAQYLSQTRALLAQAEQLRVPRYAPSTFARAQSLLLEAETQLNENRYDTDLPRSLAQQANYEARHAIFLAAQIERIDEEEITAEDVILRYEEPLTQIAAAADRVAPLDEGTDEITAELIAYLEQLREEAEQARIDLADSRVRVAELEDEVRELDEQLGGVSQERVALVQRLEAEARIREQFATIENLFERDEARVSREGNNLIIRLVGLTFDSGGTEIAPEHHELLQDVYRAASVFPRSQIVVEGHTDSYGSDDTNMRLSQERADAVSAYLADTFGVPAFRISAVGYGETRPIANNETPQGRERNRRIDVRIEPELD